MKKILVLLVALIGFGIGANAQVIITQENKKNNEELENKGCGYSITDVNKPWGGLKFSNSCKFKNYKVKITYKKYEYVDRYDNSGMYGQYQAINYNSTPKIITKIVYLGPNTKDELIEGTAFCEYVDDECLNCNE